MIDRLVILIATLNQGMDRLVPALCIFVLIWLIFSYIRKRIEKDGVSKGIYLAALATLEAIILVIIIDVVPSLVSKLIKNLFESATIRWLILYLIALAFWNAMSRKNGEKRGLYAIMLLLTVCLLGWLYNRWVGMLFISLPTLYIFYHVADKLAQVIVPTSDPEDKHERRQKTQAFINYLLGIQHPFWIAGQKAGREFDLRISGDTTNDFAKPGVVWTWSHQVVGLSKGIEFNSVDGPGTVFTKVYEAPIALIDLRTQLRTSTIEAVTKDGMKVPAVVFMAFAIDREKWPKDGWSRANFAKMKHRFPDGLDPDHKQGSYPYSSSRVRTALSTISINTNRGDGDKPEFYWDEWVVRQVEQATREVLSGRSLDELWRPRNDGLGISALDEMAVEIKEQAIPQLEDVGIQLFGARIVNYEFDQESAIAVQNVKTWSTYWEQQITEAHADAEAIYREEIEKAHAFSKSVLLDAIAESINAARKIDRHLPRHVIAQYYVHALEEYIKKQPGTDIDESRKRVDDLKNFLLYSRTEANE